MSTTRKLTTKTGYKYSIEEFDNAMEVALTNRSRSHRHNGDAFTRKESSFTGVENYNEAEEMLKDGWTKGLEEVTLAMHKIAYNGEGKRISTRNEVVGFAPIVPLAIQGIPNCMSNTYYKPIKAKVLDIYYSISCGCGVDHKDILKVGMVTMKYIVALENKGYRVRLNAVQSYSGGSDCDMMILRLKSENQPLDVRRVMFPMMHPGMFRAIGFAWYERSPVTTERFGYGNPIESTNGSNPKNLEEVFGKNSVFIDCAKYVKDSEVKIEKKLVDLLEGKKVTA